MATKNANRFNDKLQKIVELKLRENPNRLVKVPMNVLEEVIHYCEYTGIYDKLGTFGDFYYKLVKIVNNQK